MVSGEVVSSPSLEKFEQERHGRAPHTQKKGAADPMVPAHIPSPYLFGASSCQGLHFFAW